MNVPAVVLALWAALANGAASVLQRRAAMEQTESEAVGGRPAVWQGMRAPARLVRRPLWPAGVTALGLSAVPQAGAPAACRWFSR